MNELYRLFGIIALVIAIGLGLVIVALWPPDASRSFSQHIAKRKAAYWLFAPVFTIVTVMYYLFLWQWVGPHIGVAIMYYAVLAVALVLQLIIVWVPAKHVWPMRVHNIAAYTVAGLMVVLVAVTALTASPALSVGYAVACYTFVAIGMLIGPLYIYVPVMRERFLIVQIGYFVAFLLVMALAYV
jgi:hypothetical protein